MKKVLYLLVTLLFTLTLVSCKKGKQITLSYDKSEIEIFVGDEVNVKPNVEVGKKVKNYELNYELSENIATIKDGKLTANEKGTVVVTVTTDQDKDAVASLKVVIKEKEIIPTEYKITLDADGGIVEKTEITNAVITSENLTVKILSEKMGKPAAEIIKKFMMLGMMPNINSVIDYQTVQRPKPSFQFQPHRRYPDG